MGWRGTIALAAAFVVAAAYAYVDLVSQNGKLSMEAILQPSPPTPPGEGNHTILAFDPGEIVAVVIRRGNEETRIRRSGTTWVGVAPPDAVDDLLANVGGLVRILALDVPPQELADHGLDPPRTVITLERRGAPALSLHIGNHNPPATGVYVQVAGSPEVILTGSLLLWEVEKVMKAARAEHG